MNKLILAGVVLTASALALTGCQAAPVEEKVGMAQLGAEVDARLHADLARLAKEAAEHNAASRHGRGVKVASR